MTKASNLYRDFRHLAAVIEHAVWLYYCFSLSLRFGRQFANTLKRRRPRPGDKWYLDEVSIRPVGKQHYLWRAVDQDGNVLEIQVQSRRNTRAARRFFRKLLRGLQYVSRVIITDMLKSYAAAKRTILPHIGPA